MAELFGPRAPASSGRASSLVVLLHGYGADGNDLFGLSRPLAGVLRDTAFVAPHAPDPCEMGGPGFQWFGLMGPGGRIEARVADADAVAPKLAHFIEVELARHELTADRLALIGFSQGTMMALHVGLAMTEPPAAIIGFSGRLLAPDRLRRHASGRPSILLVHGSADPVVPSLSLEEAAAGLRQAGYSPETLMRPGLGHGIDDIGFSAAADFLAKHF